LKREPSEYILDHCLFGMVRDAPVLQMGSLMSLDHFAWGSDFPHSVGSYPNSKQYLEDALSGLDASVKRKLLAENIAAHLGLDLDADLTETPA
jgi:hypothetical protein